MVLFLSFNLTGAHDSKKQKEIEKSVESMHLLSLRISLNLLDIIQLKRKIFIPLYMSLV